MLKATEMLCLEGKWGGSKTRTVKSCESKGPEYWLGFVFLESGSIMELTHGPSVPCNVEICLY